MKGRENRMNNEERILALLTQMQSDMADVKETIKQHGERLDHLDERTQRIALLMEVEFQNKLQALYDGHQTILETLTPPERIDALETDVSVLKMAVHRHTEEIKDLRKAQ